MVNTVTVRNVRSMKILALDQCGYFREHDGVNLTISVRDTLSLVAAVKVMVDMSNIVRDVIC